MESVWWIYWLMDSYEKGHSDEWIKERIKNIIEEKKDKEISEALEYNYFILEEMIEFINDVSHCKEMMSINLSWSEFLESYTKIIKFLLKYHQYIKELWINDEMLVLANNMFIYYSKWHLNSLNGFESLISNYLIDKSVNFDFSEDFYDEMKESLVKFIEILNNDLLLKKTA